ncbi:MAG: leucine-rich repeat domain-containing protein, partial [Erysipelotrichaceae bacterium]|nr:leucine-rich repeat domain-containing protein [Erysipelotrichaceae bacterium]
YNGTDTDLVIPQTIDDLEVTSIDEKAFLNCQQLESIVIPYGVKSIGCLAFSGCIHLKEIVLPDSLEYIYENTFRNCTSLDMTILDGIEIIKDD